MQKMALHSAHELVRESMPPSVAARLRAPEQPCTILYSMFKQLKALTAARTTQFSADMDVEGRTTMDRSYLDGRLVIARIWRM
eukprot:SAG31_NODE_255_length_19039_cov_83.461774_4_plen_83_part_00